MRTRIEPWPPDLEALAQARRVLDDPHMQEPMFAVQPQVGVALNVLRTVTMQLVQRWQARRIGDDVVGLFLTIESSVLAEPRDLLASVRGIRDLVVLLRSKAPTASPVMDPTIAAAVALFNCLDDDYRVSARGSKLGA